MDDKRLQILVDYLNVLSSLNGSYHKEIQHAIIMIEKELGIPVK